MSKQRDKLWLSVMDVLGFVFLSGVGAKIGLGIFPKIKKADSFKKNSHHRFSQFFWVKIMLCKQQSFLCNFAKIQEFMANHSIIYVRPPIK